MATKSSKSRSDTAVQGTNDSSIVSKCSAAKCGYFTDPFLQHLVAKEARRAPLINRGYYIRAKAVEFAVCKFFSLFGDVKTQVLCLGCGFDSGFFRLKSQGLLKNATYVEVDFLEVAERKKQLIEDRQTLKEMLETNCQNSKQSHIVLDCGHYKLLGVDLTQLQLLEDTLRAVGVDFSLPSLLVSEVAVTYMPHKSATRILHWASHTFSNAAFLMYEQIIPNDAFGQFMQAHFNSLGSTLKSINTYPTLLSQKRRALEQGWREIFAVDMNTFYREFLSDSERTKVERLEPFDEHEEFHLKCSHYYVMVATGGSCVEMAHQMHAASNMTPAADLCGSSSRDPSVDDADVPAQLSAFPIQSNFDKSLHAHSESNIRVSGHASCVLSSGVIVVTGGFGEDGGKHARWSRVALYDPASGRVDRVKPLGVDSGWCPVERLHHTATAVRNDRVVIVGGRTSPTKPCATVCVLHIQDKGDDSQTEAGASRWSCSVQTLPRTDPGPTACWRHSATRIQLRGVDHLLLFGGRTEVSLALDQCFLLNTDTFAWHQVEASGSLPGPRHSHSATLHRDSVVVCGGLDARLEPSGAVHVLNTQSWQWTCLNVPNLTPRFSHACVMIGDDKLVVIGGVGAECPPPGCAVVDLNTQHCVEHPLPTYGRVGEHSDPLVMLHNHSACVIPRRSSSSTQLQSSGTTSERHRAHDSDTGSARAESQHVDAAVENTFCPSDVDILVIGGGGNCFSFGTHLNNTPLVLL